MFKVPIQNVFGAGLLLTLAFSVNDSSSTLGPDETQAKVQLACDEGSPSHGMTPNSDRDGGLCREIDFP